MKSNLLEIKRFLKDYKVFILIGSVIISFLFAVAFFFLGINDTETALEDQDEYEFAPDEIINETQPAYFQFYMESEDGIAYGNSAIFNQYFNLKKIKEDAEKATNVDIKKVEEEVEIKGLGEDVKVIHVDRHGSSYLFTASFNLGNEEDNLAVAKYYYKVLFEDELGILEDKNTYVFSEPVLAKSNQDTIDSESLVEEESQLTKSNLISHLKNAIIGLALGIITMTGIALLKEIFGEKLNYSFGYEVNDDTEFKLLDTQLENQDLIAQFVAVPLREGKVILSEQPIDLEMKQKLVGNNQLTFDQKKKDLLLVKELNTLSGINMQTVISELIIIINPGLTTRKWYRKQQEFAEINDFPTKIIQMNKNN